jgi:hypothetical protein
MYVIGVCEFCCNGEDSVCGAVVVVLWQTSWDLVLLAMLWSPSSDVCGEDCSLVTSFEGDTTGVGALLDCSLLDCVEDITSVSSSEGDTIRVWALLESSLLECSSPELCGSVSDPESKLSEAERWECRMRGTVSATSAA